MRLRTHFLAAACAVGLAACAGGQASPYPAGTSTIFEGERALELVRQCSRTEPGPVEDVWTPTEADIARLEVGLPELFDERAEARWPDDDLVAQDYYRQYGGLVIGGRRVVYVNGFASRVVQDWDRAEPPLSWREQAVQVCDGGPIVFGVEYEPETDAFANFAFNGAF